MALPNVERAEVERTERLHRFSHALRNKLAGLMEAIRFLDGDLPQEQRREIASFAERKFFEGLREVEDLMDDLHVERGMGQLHPEDIDLAPVIREAADDARPRLDRKDQQLHVEIAAPLPVRGDAHYLLPAIQALLGNACKFSPRGATIIVDGRRVDQWIILTVTDPGVGLSTEDLERVFMRYAWLDSRSTDGESQGRSTLARVRQWVAAHGGDITAHSDGPGKGSTFVLTLPALGA